MSISDSREQRWSEWVGPTGNDSIFRRLAACALAVLLTVPGAAGLAQPLPDKVAQKMTQCAACHGEDGRSADPRVPNIGGQPKLAVMYQLFFFREGRRKSPEMNAIAKELSDAELTAIAERVARLPPPPPAGGAVDGARYKRGAELAAKRRCATCHNADFSGRAQMPRLAGQHEAYLVGALKDYRAGVRVGTQAVMAEAVHGLADRDFEDLAYFLARVRP